jgi:hypothetical protein
MNRGTKDKYENHCLVKRNYKTSTDQDKIILQLTPSQQTVGAIAILIFTFVKYVQQELNYLQKTITIHNFRQLRMKTLLILLITEL